MAADCTFNQTLGNLKNNLIKVFESILLGESRVIVGQVKAFREQQIWPTCRARYKIRGEPYRETIERTFITSMPLVYAHLKKRLYFCDYLLLTGIFNSPELDTQHRALYDRLLAQYLEREAHSVLYGHLGNPEVITQNSDKAGRWDHEHLSLRAEKDGRPCVIVKSDIFSFG